MAHVPHPFLRIQLCPICDHTHACERLVVMQEKALEKAFSRYGKVEHIRMLRDKGSASPASMLVIQSCSR